MIITVIILAILLMIALLRFGVIVEYGIGGLTAFVRVGFLLFHIYPKPEKTPKNLKKEAKRKAKRLKKKLARKAKKDKIKAETEKPGAYESFSIILSAVKNTLSRFKRKLLIKELTIHYTAAGDDPSKTALLFGGANAVFALIESVLNTGFRIKQKDFRAEADFESDKQRIYLKAKISLAVWEAVYISFAVIPAIVKLQGKPKDSMKGKKDGKETNYRAIRDNDSES